MNKSSPPQHVIQQKSSTGEAQPHQVVLGSVRLSCFSSAAKQNLICDLRDFRHSGDWLYFYVAQSSGPDSEKAKLGRFLKTFFQETLERSSEIGLVDVLRKISQRYAHAGFREEASVQLARYHLKDRSLECVRAGSLQSLKVQKNGSFLIFGNESGPVLTQRTSDRFDSSKYQVHVDILKPGDSTFFFNEIFDLSGTAELLARAAAEEWQSILSQGLSDALTVIRMEVLEVKKALVLAPEATVVERVQAEIKSLEPEFKVEVTGDLSEALARLSSDLVNVVLLQDQPSAALPIDRDFSTVVVTSHSDASLEKILAGKADLVFSEPFEIRDLIESVKNPEKHREKGWRRYTERMEVAVSMSVELNGVDDFKQGDVVNLGLGGMFVGISFPIPEVGEKVSFKLNYTTGENSVATIEGIGVVRWVRLESSGVLRAGCGVQFLSLTEESIKNVREIVTASRTREMIPQY